MIPRQRRLKYFGCLKLFWQLFQDPFFFQVAAPIITKPISNLFNQSLLSGDVPIAWKAMVRPLFKGGDQADPNC
jgi:hypothetical protein